MDQGYVILEIIILAGLLIMGIYVTVTDERVESEEREGEAILRSENGINDANILEVEYQDVSFNDCQNDIGDLPNNEHYDNLCTKSKAEATQEGEKFGEEKYQDILSRDG